MVFFLHATLQAMLWNLFAIWERRLYTTVSNLSWSVDIRKHAIVNMVETVLADPWPPVEELGREVPEAVPQDDCVVSFLSTTHSPRRSFESTFGGSIPHDH